MTLEDAAMMGLSKPVHVHVYTFSEVTRVKINYNSVPRRMCVAMCAYRCGCVGGKADGEAFPLGPRL